MVNTDVDRYSLNPEISKEKIRQPTENQKNIKIEL